MVRHAEAEWSGSLKEGKGRVKVETGAINSPYSFRSRFEGGGETNPEELLGASHAGCFTMALSAALTNAGHPPSNIKTTAAVTLTPVDGKPTITRIDLTTQATVPGIDNTAFQKIAADAKAGCPISRALGGTEIHLDAKLT
ncbi:MAG TPA: OsmC family protein [Bryobacteraceae bacterium]|nr:OsmC family protein [Bryobacteraceae bacterium]